MKELLKFLVKGLIGEGKFDIKETTDANFSTFTIQTEPSLIGILIGRGGNTIKAIRNILKVRAILEKKGVNVAIAAEDATPQKDSSGHQ